MILHLSRMRRNVNRKVYNDRENVSATAAAHGMSGPSLTSHLRTAVSTMSTQLATAETHSSPVVRYFATAEIICM